MKWLWLRLAAFGFSPAAILGASSVACHGADFYVATNGSDSNPGTIAQPFATLEAARNAIRALNSGLGLPTGGVRVNLRGGRYMRQSPFTLLGRQDSGTPTSPILYQAYAGETPTIIGGMSVTGFQSVTDPTILARLTSAAQTNVVVANLTVQGITNIIPLATHGAGFWGAWPGQNELFFQDQPMQLARYPNTGWLYTTSPIGTNYFGYTGTNPSTWATLSDVWVDGYWRWDWADECDQVSSIDTANHIAYVASPASQYGYAAGQRFFFLNVLEELDSPGEYYIDRVNRLLYFWPPSRIDSGNPFISTVGDGSTVWSAAGGLLNLQSVSNVAWSGITFKGAVGPLLLIWRGNNNTITNCTFSGGACDGVDLVFTMATTVTRCTMANMGQIGVSMNDNANHRLTLTPTANSATCNIIHDMSRLCWTYNPGITLQGVGNCAAHNLIYNGRHNAILLSGNNHIVEYNEIHHVCTETSDAGAIYMGRDWTMRGNVLRYNYLHDINLGGGATGATGVNGIYLDDLWSGTTIYGNIFCAVDYGIEINGGRDNTVQNNIFVGCATEAISFPQSGFGYDAYLVTNSNSQMWTELGAVPYQAPPWSVEYPGLVGIATNNPAAALGNVIQSNISYNNASWIVFYYGAETNVTVANNFTSGNPLFVDYAQRNFMLSTNSPAFALGFQQVPMKRFGPVPGPPQALRLVGP